MIYLLAGVARPWLRKKFSSDDVAMIMFCYKNSFYQLTYDIFIGWGGASMAAGKIISNDAVCGTLIFFRLRSQ